MTDYLYTFFAFLPFVVCLVWLAIYTADLRNERAPQRMLTLFALLCTLLYFCHSWFFVGPEEGGRWVDAVYLFCNLSVYPVYYCYIRILAKDDFTWWQLALSVLPATILTLALILTGANPAVVWTGKIVFALEVVQVAVSGLKLLNMFDRQVENCYADTEGKTLRRISVLLVCILITSLLSTVANIIGRDGFQHSLLLGIPSILFSSMLFGVFFVGHGIRFYAYDLRMEFHREGVEEDGAGQGEVQLEAEISSLMAERQLFLQHGLRISDLAEQVGSNRTYVSNAINNIAGMSFSDYVNSRRIAFAKQRLAEEGDTAISQIASESGFASFPSFYRAFVKFVGMSPSAWLKLPKR